MDTHLQPPFFSILFSHFGHVRVFALIHCEVPASSRAFFSHVFTSLQVSGRWSESIPHPKQKTCSAPHFTVGTSVSKEEPVPDEHKTVSVHPGWGQKRRRGCAPTYDCRMSSLYLV